MKILYWIFIWPITTAIVLLGNLLQAFGWLVVQLSAPTAKELQRKLTYYKKHKRINLEDSIELSKRIGAISKDTLTTELLQIDKDLTKAAYGDKVRK